MWSALLAALLLAADKALCDHDVISTGRDFSRDEQPDFWKIIGGEEAAYGEFPFMLSLMVRGNFMCGASVIGDHWALTAAHCIDRGDPEHYALRAGSLKYSSGGTVHQAERLVVHHLYRQEENFDNDIGLIKVTKPLTDNKYVKVVALPGQRNLPLPPGTSLIVSGWGIVGPMGEATVSPVLKKAHVVVLSKETCEEDPTLSGSMIITEHMVCAQKKGHTAYKGDSGGPLTMRGNDGSVTQVGVVSWGDFTGEQKHATVYTRVSAYRLWIRMKTGI